LEVKILIACNNLWPYDIVTRKNKKSPRDREN
jgi:hypothetical protein